MPRGAVEHGFESISSAVRLTWEKYGFWASANPQVPRPA